MNGSRRGATVALIAVLASLAASPLIASGDDPKPQGGARADNAQRTELPDARTRTSRTYATPDGSRVTRLYAGAVNYRKDGEWHVIDNTLVPSSAPGYAFENKDNSYTARFPSDISGEPVRIERGGDWLEFKLEDAHASGSAARREASYDGAFPGVDVSYVADATSVKESLTLSNAAARARYSFTLDMSDGIRPRESEAGGIEFVDENGDGDVVFSFAPPYMYDAAGARSDEVTMQLRRGSGGYEVAVAADREWIESSDREFPVVIDPNTNVAVCDDCYMVGGSQANSHFCGYADNWMTVGTAGGTDGLNPRRGFISFDTSAIPKDSEVMYADMGLYYGAGASRKIDVHRLTRSSTTGRTWNTYDGTNAWTNPGGDIDSSAAASNSSAGGNGVGWYHWYPTELVQNWVDGSNANHGVVLKDNLSSGAGSVIQFAQHEQAGLEPYIDVKWKHRNGREPQYTFDSQQISDRASLNTNVANGNLLVEENDLSIAGTGLDAHYSRYWNSLNFDGGDGVSGLGWNASAGWAISATEFADGRVVRLEGPSGYDEPFLRRADGSYKSPTGLNMTLKKDATNGTYTITEDRTQHKMYFPCSNCAMKWEKDRNGNQVWYDFDAVGTRMNKIADTRGRATRFTYTSSGATDTITDPTGRVWNYGYTGARLTSYTNPAGKVTSYAYDASGHLTQITDPRGNRTKMTYDSGHRVKTIMRVTGQDAGGNDTGPTTTYTYKTTVGSACASGTFGETVVTDANGHDTTYCYDRELRVTRVKDARGKSRDKSWTPNSDADVITSAGQQATKFTYDSDNRLKDQQQPAASTGGNGLKNTLGYDSGVTDKSDPRYQLPKTATDTQQNQLTYGYDGNGNVTSVDDQLTQNNQVKLHRRSDGQIDWVKDPNDQAQPDTNPTTSLVYNTIGELTSINRPSPLGDESFTYDGLSRPNLLTDGRGQTDDYDFDAMDRLTKITYSDGSSVTYGYDNNGNLTSRTDNTGQTTYVYDQLNRLSTENFPGSRTNTYTYDGVGKLKTFVDAGGTTTYNYGPSNLLDSLQAPGDSAATTFTYDDDDRRKTTAYPNGVTMTASYDNPGRLTEIKATKTGVTTPLSDFVYGYDTVPASCGSTAAAAETNLRQKVTDVAASPNKVTTYCYDKLNRLTKATEAPGSTYAYQYDGNGNITRRTKDGAATSYGFNRANELCWSVTGAQAASACAPTPTGATTYAYDGAGDLTSSSAGLSLAYNAKEQTTSMTGLGGGTATAMTYAGPNQLERATLGSTTHTTGGLGVNVDKTGTSPTYYRRDNDGTLHSERLPSGAIHYYLFDGLGSTAALADATGAKSQSYTYDPYGATTVGNATGAANPWRYAGTYQDPTGFYKMGLRYYSPALMRWTQQDAFEHHADLQEGNRYAYVGGNPINNIDPTGTTYCTMQTCYPQYRVCSGSSEVTSSENECSRSGGLRITPRAVFCAAAGAAVGYVTRGRRAQAAAGFTTSLGCDAATSD